MSVSRFVVQEFKGFVVLGRVPLLLVAYRICKFCGFGDLGLQGPRVFKHTFFTIRGPELRAFRLLGLWSSWLQGFMRCL